MKTDESIHFIKDSNKHWWYVGRRAIVKKVLAHFHSDSNKTALELGAGFGGMTDLLFPHVESVDVMEPMEKCQEALSDIKGIRNIYSRPQDIPSENHFGGVYMFDVLEHIEDDETALKDIFSKYLKDGGELVITVPAYQWMWSQHDTEHAHFRRYTKKGLKKKLLDAGFEVQYSSYAMTLLFPLVFFARLLKLGGSGMDVPARPINTLLKTLFSIESLVIPTLSFSFGLSVVAVAKKQ